MKEMEHKLSSFTVVLEQPGQEDIENLLRIRDMWDRNCKTLRDKLNAAEHQREVMDIMIESARSASLPGSTEQMDVLTETPEKPRNALPKVESADGDAEPVSGAATAKDIAHCRTQREAGRVIAEINGGPIDLKSAARVIKAAGLSDGMLNTIVSSLHHFMSHSSDWRYTGPSAFELLTHRESAPESASETDSVDEDLSEEGVSEASPTTLREYEETAA